MSVYQRVTCACPLEAAGDAVARDGAGDYAAAATAYDTAIAIAKGMQVSHIGWSLSMFISVHMYDTLMALCANPRG